MELGFSVKNFRLWVRPCTVQIGNTMHHANSSWCPKGHREVAYGQKYDGNEKQVYVAWCDRGEIRWPLESYRCEIKSWFCHFLACWLYDPRHITVQESQRQHLALGTDERLRDPLWMSALKKHTTRDRRCFFVCEMILRSFLCWNHSGWSMFVSVPGWSAQLVSPALPPSFPSSYITILFRGSSTADWCLTTVSWKPRTAILAVSKLIHIQTEEE